MYWIQFFDVDKTDSFVRRRIRVWIALLRILEHRFPSWSLPIIGQSLEFLPSDEALSTDPLNIYLYLGQFSSVGVHDLDWVSDR